jgi:hypothetical protein
VSSTIQASTYDWAVAVTKSDTTNDPAGPFTGLYVSAGGTLVCDNLGGPQGSNPITITVVAGGYICWPIKRIRTATTATVFGLVSPVATQGAV